MLLDDARHQRAAVEFVEYRAGKDQAREVAHGLGVGIGEKVGYQIPLDEQHVAQLFAGGLVWRRLDTFKDSEKKRRSLERVKPRMRFARSGRGDVLANPTQQL